MPALCDVNFVVAMCHRAHQHHGAAKSWLDAGKGDAGLILCRVSQLGMLRVLTNPAIMGGEVCTTDEAWEVHDALMRDSRFSYRDEPIGLQVQLREFTRGYPFSPKLWQDAYLAAFAVTADLELITFDRGFGKFSGLRAEILGG
jgi:uncharacterized protein